MCANLFLNAIFWPFLYARLRFRIRRFNEEVIQGGSLVLILTCFIVLFFCFCFVLILFSCFFSFFFFFFFFFVFFFFFFFFEYIHERQLLLYCVNCQLSFLSVSHGI